MRPVHVAWLLCLSFPAAALAASPPPSKSVPPPKCTATIGVPALDAGSKDAAKMTTKVNPQAHKGGKAQALNIGSQSSGAGAGKIHSCVTGQHDDEAPKETKY